MFMKTQGKFLRNVATARLLCRGFSLVKRKTHGPAERHRGYPSEGEKKQRILKCKNEAIMLLKTKDRPWVRLPKRTHFLAERTQFIGLIEPKSRLPRAATGGGPAARGSG
jgi:hypothetical protein